MEILENWKLDLDVDAVLRGEGSDPEIIKKRSPRLVAIAQQALEQGLPLIRPRALVERFKVDALKHNRLILAGGGSLQGDLIAEHLAATQEVVVILCTIGDELETLTAKVILEDSVLGLALDGLGSAAAETLANMVTVRIEQEAAAKGLQTTMPLNPGLIGWQTNKGQDQIFKLVDGAAIGIKLTESKMMLPIKSLSVVIGLGKDLRIKTNMCDYCVMRDVCRYKDHNEH